VICLVIVIVGAVTVVRMPVDLFPPINIPVDVIATFYSGMPPQQIETNITNPFERWFTLASGVDHIESRSLPGVSLIKIYFQPGTNADSDLSTVSNLAMADLRRMGNMLKFPSQATWQPHNFRARTVVLTRPSSDIAGRASGGVARVELSGREAELLAVLARRPTRVFGRDELRDRVFPDADSGSIVDTYVHYLRRKLGRQVVRTVHGVGYQLGPATVDSGAP